MCPADPYIPQSPGLFLSRTCSLLLTEKQNMEGKSEDCVFVCFCLLKSQAVLCRTILVYMSIFLWNLGELLSLLQRQIPVEY